MVLGHEAAGVVEEVGHGVIDVVPGDQVVCRWTSGHVRVLETAYRVTARGVRQADRQDIGVARPAVVLGQSIVSISQGGPDAAHARRHHDRQTWSVRHTAWRRRHGGRGRRIRQRPEVHVYLGDHEITGIVRTEVSETNRATRTRA